MALMGSLHFSRSEGGASWMIISRRPGERQYVISAAKLRHSYRDLDVDGLGAVSRMHLVGLRASLASPGGRVES